MTLTRTQVGSPDSLVVDSSRDGRPGAAYARIDQQFAARRCVILDGGMATELGRILPADERRRDEALWGPWALLHAPDAVRDVHSHYLDIGCDVISTNTWGLSGATDEQRAGFTLPVHWMDLARRGIHLGREAIATSGRGEVALAFSINGDVSSEARLETLRLLPRVFEEDPPDLILLETMTLVRDNLTDALVAALVAGDIPVWVSFRRCRHGVCGVYGQHWGGPEGDDFGRAARRFEELGARALLINCLPPDHVPGMLPWLRDFTDLPLGVYPNLGYYTEEGWSFDQAVGGAQYAELAAQWRAEGADIIGGCCGVRPEHIAAARERVGRLPRGNATVAARPLHDPLFAPTRGLTPDATGEPWVDDRGRRLFPLEMPELVCEPGVFVPTQGSFLVWKHLFTHDIGRSARCLDIGCGTGLLTIQLARNEAEHVHAIDIDERAANNTMSNAFRNGVADRVSAEAVDLFPWVPKERYDVVVASLFQMPVDPYEQPNGHRPLDFWGRNLVDHLITLLPRLLEADGVAYLMQLSILGQERTAGLLREHGFRSRVIDFAFFDFHALFSERRQQIDRVEQLSDAYHLRFGAEDVLVAYLVEVTRETPDGRSVAA